MLLRPSWSPSPTPVLVLLGMVALAPALSAAIVPVSQAGADAVLGAAPDGNARLVLAAAQQGYLGVTVRDVDADRAEKLKLPAPVGAEVISLDHDAPACKAGIRANDVIQTLNGQPVPDSATLSRLLRDMPAGKFVDVEVMHNGKLEKIHLQLADRATLVEHAWSHHFRVPLPSPAAPVEGFAAAQHSYFNGSTATNSDAPDPQAYVGAQVEPLTAQLARFFGVHAGAGLLVRAVEDRSPASNAGMEAGDVLLNAAGVVLSSTADWIQMLRTNAGRPMQITVLRNRKLLTLAITVDARITQSELVVPLELQRLRESLDRHSL